MNLTLSEMHRRLAIDPENLNPVREANHESGSSPISAAVLVPLLEIENDWHLLFIRRAINHIDAHSGQVAFPGGRRETVDPDLQTTALREAHEEIGLQNADVEVIGRLPELVSATHYQITPFVGKMQWPYPLRLAPTEVARAFTIPLRWLADEKNREIYDYATPSGAIPVIRFRNYDGEQLWGATARITVSLLQKLANIPDPVGDHS